MEVQLVLEPGRKEPKAVILAGEESDEVRRLIDRLRDLSLSLVPARRGQERLLLPQGTFLRFFTDGKGVSGQTRDEILSVPLRLYELEQLLDRTRFVRISNGEILDLEAVTAVDLSLTGTICMTLEGGTRAYVSRRYMKQIKETLQARRYGHGTK